MSLSNGLQMLAMPGPTNVPERVLSAMHRPAIDIYSGELVGVTESCMRDLRSVFRTAHDVYVYISNGHGAWEAALANTLSRGERILVLESGRFAVGWGGMGSSMGLQVDVMAGDWHRAVDPAAVEQTLRADEDKAIKAVIVVQVDTASGCVNDLGAIRRAIDAADHPAMLMVDTIASLGTMAFEMDAWGVDVAVCGSQKGLMMPPGLGFVAAGPKAKQAHRSANLRTRYWDWSERDGPEHYQKYCGTPPEHQLFGLREALDILLAEGLPNAIRRHELLAGATRAAVQTWTERGMFDFNIAEPAERANSVTTLRMMDSHDPDAIVEFCQQQCGITLGVGIGELSGKGFRIAHMGHCNAPMVLGTLASIEIAMDAVACGDQHNYPSGIAEATRYLASRIAA